jgi:spermidine synthase
MTRPWVTLESADTPEGPLALKRRGDTDYLITLAGRVVMTSATHRSEDALAKLGCAGLGGTVPARVLVSGLGMGFTLRAALDELGPSARVTVAELNGIVASWCQGSLAPLTKGAAIDPRVTLVVADVNEVLARAGRSRHERFDAILLDLYQGPQSRVSYDDPLYGPTAVGLALGALVPGGLLAVWCEQPSPGYEQVLTSMGFTIEKQRSGKGGRVHLIYLARAPKEASQRPRGERRKGR